MTDNYSELQVASRPFRDDEDFFRVRGLLDETYPIAPPGFNWEVRRWDGRRFYNENPDLDPRWKETVRLWETDDGHLVGAVHPEGSGDAFLQLHPDYRQIEEEMIVWAEDNLAVPANDGSRRRLSFYVFEYDTPRRMLLEKRGYEKTSSSGVFRRLRFGNRTIPRATMADGYTLYTVQSENDADCRAIADILNAAFGRDFHNPGEYRQFATHAPCCQPGLDLAAVTPDGTYAAYVGVPYNEAHRYGVFEPVCTHPDHQRRGLARSLMLEALYRLRALGAADVYVGTGDQVAANRLYDAVGFTEAYRECEWRRVF